MPRKKQVTLEAVRKLARQTFLGLAKQERKTLPRGTSPAFWAELAGICLSTAYIRERLLVGTDDTARRVVEDAFGVMQREVSELLPDRARIGLAWLQPPLPRAKG